MKILLSVICLLLLTSCGPSQKDRDIAAVTCAIMGETRNMDAAVRVREINEAREKIGGEPFLRGDYVIKKAFEKGLCQELVLNTYDEKLQEITEEDPEVTLQEMMAEIEDTEAALAGSLEPMSADIEQKFLISYYNFIDPFTTKLNGSKKVVQVKIGLSTYHDKDTLFNEEEGSEGWIPRHLIGIRAQILKVLRRITLEELQAMDGQDNVLEEIKLVINETLEKYEKTKAAPIFEAYFTEFIVQ